MAETKNPVIDAGQFLGEDGALSENWLEQAYGENDPMRSDATLKNTKDVRSMAAQLVNSQKQIGQFSGGREFAILPNEQSTEDEISEYHKKTGRPDAPEGYKLSSAPVPDGVPKTNEKFMTHMEQVLFKAGTSSTMASKIVQGFMEFNKTSFDERKTQEALDDATANKELRGKLGAAYDKTMRDITTLVSAIGNTIDPTATAELLKDLPNDSFAAQLLGKIAERFGEGGLGVPPTPGTGELTPDSAMAKFNELTKDPYYMTASPKDKPRNQAYHDELIQKGAALMTLATNKGGA